MFRGIREKLQAVNPELLFSSYNMLQPELSDFLEAMHTPERPFLVLDARHYQNDDRQPWWESYSARLKQDGYLYIAGGWTNALFGAQPSQVSAARWIYETSINEDGVWIWFEHELTEDNLRAYAAADREIKAVQRRVGGYLFHGRRDLNFVTAAEWTGRPELEKAVICRTYHRSGAHLTHVNNVHTEWPLRVRLRFPRLAETGRWTVRDPMGDLYYTRDSKSTVWTSADLLAGVVVAVEPRSDLFLLISPFDEEAHVDPSTLIRSCGIDDLPEHAAASAQANPVEAKVFSLPKGGWLFKMDGKEVGVKAEWFLPTAPLDGWTPIDIEGFWGDKGGTGAGWYRRDVSVPALPEGRKVYLHFGAVDEELMLWIDGRHVGDHNIGPDGWDKPFAMDVTGKLTAGKHHVAMRVYNTKAAGGVWKPVTVLAGTAVAGGRKTAIVRSAPSASGRLVYTATEEMGFEGFSGCIPSSATPSAPWTSTARTSFVSGNCAGVCGRRGTRLTANGSPSSTTRAVADRFMS